MMIITQIVNKQHKRIILERAEGNGYGGKEGRGCCSNRGSEGIVKLVGRKTMKYE